MQYPNDATGDALRRMEDGGDDLSRARDIDFTIVFPDRDSAETFAKHFRELGYKASVELTKTNEDLPWDVVVIRRTVPSYEEIGAFESFLQNVADSLGGRNDGWGCMS